METGNKMTNEEKLLVDLCARLPYGTIVSADNGKYREDIKLLPHHLNLADFNAWDIKPYLRPMSSMTEEEKKELKSLLHGDSFGVDYYDELVIYFNSGNDCDYYFSEFYKIQDWLLSHHFDFRGLIEKGLALEAPDGMYNTK